MTVSSLDRPASAETRTALAILVALSVCHGLNDTIQSLLPAIYPVLQQNYALTFTQIGILHFAFQVTASLLQPAIGLYTDKRPLFRLSTAGMGASLLGLVLLATAHHFWALVAAAMLIGVGSSIFHPDSSRIARTASGGRYGLAQSIFQVGGNTGSAIGPLLAAYVVLPLGQSSIAWFSALALLGMIVLWNVGSWARERHLAASRSGRVAVHEVPPLPRGQTIFAMAVLVVLLFSKFVYLASLTSYYTFYLIETFGVSVRDSQLFLFLFLAAGAVGTFAGGPIGDRVGRKAVMWVSILGVLPFTLALPHVGLVGTAILSFIIGFLLSSAFSAIIVYAQGLVPGRVGLVSGIFFGLAFGLAGVAAAALGVVADLKGIAFVYHLCAFLPALGLATILLPSEEKLRRR